MKIILVPDNQGSYANWNVGEFDLEELNFMASSI